MKILVTDGGYRNSLAIVRHLGRLGANICVIDTNRGAMSFSSRYCQSRFIGPSPFDERAYINFVRNLVEHEHFDLVIPVGFRSTEVISKNKKELEQFVNIEIADYESISIALNKKRTYELAEKVGVPYPRTIYPNTFDELVKLSNIVNYPVVIKGLFEAGHNIVEWCINKEQMLSKYYTICRKNNFTDGSLPMLQEYITGESNQYCFSALYQNGKCKRMFMQRQIRNVPIKGGTAAYAESIYYEQLRDYSLRLLNELNWHGAVHVEFKLDHTDNELKLMEINPKFWASLDMVLTAGVNFPLYLYQISKGVELDYSEEYDRGLKFHFPLSGELLHLRQKPSSVINIILDTLNPKVKSNIWLTDLKPNLLEFCASLLSILPNPKVFRQNSRSRRE